MPDPNTFLIVDRAARAIPCQLRRESIDWETSFMTEIPREVAYLVSIVLIEAAIIDGRCIPRAQLADLPLRLGGWLFAYWSGAAATCSGRWRRRRGPDDSAATLCDRWHGGR